LTEDEEGANALVGFIFFFMMLVPNDTCTIIGFIGTMCWFGFWVLQIPIAITKYIYNKTKETN